MIDAAPAGYSRPDPALITVNRPDGALVAVIDGVGSWGTGMEAADWARHRLAQRWTSSSPMTPDTLAADILSVAAAIPGELQDPEWGWEFSVAALLVVDETLHALAAGIFEVTVVDAAGFHPIYDPETLMKQLLRSGQLTAEQAATFEHQNLYVGPLVGGSGAGVLARPAPFDLRRDAVVLVGHYRTIHAVRAAGPRDFLSATAAEIQAAGVACGRPASPVVLLRSQPPPGSQGEEITING